MKRGRPNAELSSMHHSRSRGFGAVRPLNMERMEISHDQAEALANISLGVFADMSNAGATFAESLSAVYMTGVQNTLAIIAEQEVPNGTWNG